MPRERESRTRRSGRSGSRRRRRSRSASPLAAPSFKVGGSAVSPHSRRDVKAPPSATPPREFVSPDRIPSPVSYAPYNKSPPGPGGRSPGPGAVVKLPPHARAAPPSVVAPGSVRSPSHRIPSSRSVRFDSESPAERELERSLRSERYQSLRAADVESYHSEHSAHYTPRRSHYRSPRRSYSRSPTSSPRRTTFDNRDRAPEDRFYEVSQQQPFGPHQRVVRGSFIIEGLNFAIYEAAGEGSDNRRRFTTALRDDIIATVGQGVRRGDIMLRAAPGPVKGVTLEFDRGTHPAIIDANWGIEFEYAIRSRDEIAQQRVGMMLFSSLQDPHGLDLLETRKCWLRYLDPNTHPGGIVAVPVADLPASEHPTSPNVQLYPNYRQRSGYY